MVIKWEILHIWVVNQDQKIANILKVLKVGIELLITLIVLVG